MKPVVTFLVCLFIAACSGTNAGDVALVPEASTDAAAASNRQLLDAYLKEKQLHGLDETSLGGVPNEDGSDITYRAGGLVAVETDPKTNENRLTLLCSPKFDGQTNMRLVPDMEMSSQTGSKMGGNLGTQLGLVGVTADVGVKNINSVTSEITDVKYSSIDANTAANAVTAYFEQCKKAHIQFSDAPNTEVRQIEGILIGVPKVIVRFNSSGLGAKIGASQFLMGAGFTYQPNEKEQTVELNKNDDRYPLAVGYTTKSEKEDWVIADLKPGGKVYEEYMADATSPDSAETMTSETNTEPQTAN